MENLKLNIDKIHGFISQEKILGYKEEAVANVQALYDKTGKGNDFAGWVKLPAAISEAELNDYEQLAHSLKGKVDFLVIIGIGGSYLGARAVHESLSHSFAFLKGHRPFPELLYAGHNISEDYMSELLEILTHHTYAIAIVSKSGTTTEPAIAFRILKNHLEHKVGKEKAKEFIIAVTDSSKGALRKMAVDEGYRSFVIPDDVGGRYSVLTPVGLVPLAIAGHDVRSLVAGARKMMELTGPLVAFEENPAAIYADARNALYKSGKTIEILANFNPKLAFIAEWWKQLYGESEGKEQKGIFPASVSFTTDLHSMGQYIQEGLRNIFETIISVKNPGFTLRIPADPQNLDELNYLSNKRLDKVNKMAELGTLLAHVDGGIPNILLEIPEVNEYYLGQLMYFFEIACGISGYLLGVNPFDQPGVEAYKKNMFALLEKPGFEEATKKIKERI
jgi:glucose-6-phosphate isomerase